MSAVLHGPEFESDPIIAILDSVSEEVELGIRTELRRIFDQIPDHMTVQVPEVFLGGILVPFHMPNVFKLSEGDRDVLLEAFGLRLEKEGSFYNLYAKVNSASPEDNSKVRLMRLGQPTLRK